MQLTIKINLETKNVPYNIKLANLEFIIRSADKNLGNQGFFQMATCL